MAKQPSIAAQAAASAPTAAGNELVPVQEFPLAELFGADSAIEIIPRLNIPYLCFAQPAAMAQWMEFVRKFPDIEDGDPILVFPEPQPMMKVTPLRFTILAAKQYYATRDATRGGADKDRFSKPGPDRVERIFSSIIIYLPDRALVATAMAKTAKCTAFQKVSAEIDMAKKPEWAKESGAHALAVVACATPHARVVGTVNMIGRTGRGTGKGYREAKVALTPSTRVEWNLLAQITVEEIKEVAVAYRNHLAELKIQPE